SVPVLILGSTGRRAVSGSGLAAAAFCATSGAATTSDSANGRNLFIIDEAAREDKGTAQSRSIKAVSHYSNRQLYAQRDIAFPFHFAFNSGSSVRLARPHEETHSPDLVSHLDATTKS